MHACHAHAYGTCMSHCGIAVGIKISCTVDRAKVMVIWADLKHILIILGQYRWMSPLE